MGYLQQLQVYYWTWPHPHRTLWHGHRGTNFYSPKGQLPGPGITYPSQTHRLPLSMFPAILKHFLSRNHLKLFPLANPLYCPRPCTLPTSTSVNRFTRLHLFTLSSTPPALPPICSLLPSLDPPLSISTSAPVTAQPSRTAVTTRLGTRVVPALDLRQTDKTSTKRVHDVT
ncbi:hypothetical protein DPEC_G00155690 [Dallia pectoralis]|uniref:Uncharacterized protein n=1 Tax=Dallia pectoralis TaxID=75939 RepID=A0ACC2GKH2_DALPE|nr:hypothetical protein DPEC_G00155690 [Dallia pectoralis]